jgi:hypothetical protein
MASRIHPGDDDIREIAHAIGRVVALRVEREPGPGMVTGYLDDADGVPYRVGWASGSESLHCAIELCEGEEP